MKSMLSTKFPAVRLAMSRARHPQTNGLIERANKVLEERICAWKLETGRTDWSYALDKLVAQRNNEYTRTTRTTPFKMFFARDPNSESEEVPNEADDFDDDLVEVSQL